MKKYLFTTILSLGLAFSAFAQTPSPTPNPNAGTYKDGTLSTTQRVSLALGVVSTGTDEMTVYAATAYILNVRPVASTVSQAPTFADTVLADLTMQNRISTPNLQDQLIGNAILYKTATTTTLAGQLAYLESVSDGNRPFVVTVLQKAKSNTNLKISDGALVARDYAKAITSATAALPFNTIFMIRNICLAKINTLAPDVLSWCKLYYYISGYANTQQAINYVGSGFRAVDINLIRANQFIQHQKDGSGPDLLASVSLPTVDLSNSDLPPSVLLFLNGQSLASLQAAAGSFAAANGNQLNGAAGWIAAALRNKDGNLIRANAFVTAQSNGQSYPINELVTSGTGQ